MLYKKFGTDIYQKIAPEYKTYQTDNGKETLLISKNYTVLKQGKESFQHEDYWRKNTLCYH